MILTRHSTRHAPKLKKRLVAVWLMVVAAVLVSPMAQAVAEPSPFEITVDGDKVAGSAAKDKAAEPSFDTLQVEVKFDGLGARPVLNVSTVPVRASYAAGSEVDFVASWNYAAFIKRAEVLIFEAGRVGGDVPLYHIPVSQFGGAKWVMPATGPRAFEYVLRVFDGENRFDQTLPLPLNRTEKDYKQHEPQDAAVAPGYGEDRTAFRNIPVSGGIITVYGHNVPAGHTVTVNGDPVPVDNESSFVTQRIMPVGQHMVDVAVLAEGKGLTFSRIVDIPSTEWFYVGQAELTARYRTGSKHIEDVRPGEYDNLYTDGHLAFYLKGKIRGEYLLTASADTGEGRLLDLFRGMDGKSPREFLERIDPNSYYPVYGDDSTSIEDAPTRGKFYIRLDRGPSHVMWGTFKANITGTQFLANDRELYGAGGVYRSQRVTQYGDAQTAGDAYVAQPGTLPQRDVMRGTGGSAYFLSHQDVTPGSETVMRQVRNAVTGVVSEQVTLSEGDDYVINYVQGLVMLNRPLPSTAANGDGNYLIVTYEYTPVGRDVNGYVYGGRAHQWLGDHLRVGVTGEVEKTGGADQKMAEADVHLQLAPDNFIEGEVARSEGPGFAKSYSTDGGLSHVEIGTAGQNGHTAYGYRGRAHATLDTLTNGKMKGDLDAYVLHEQGGFSTLTEDTDTTKTSWGAKGNLAVTDRVTAKLAYDENNDDSGQKERRLVAKTDIAVDDRWTIEPSVKLDDRQSPANDIVGNPVTDPQNGRRDDARLTIIRKLGKDENVYAFGQGTFNVSGTRKRDDRVGVGLEKHLSEKVTLEGEVSEGSLGPGAAATLTYSPSADDSYYIGYKLDQERSYDGDYPYALDGTDLGTIVGGARHRFNEHWSVFGEDNYDMFGSRLALTQAYGVTYTPSARWNVSGAVEVGRVFDDSVDPSTGLATGDLKREAVSLSALYKGENGMDGKLKGEIRHDRSNSTSASSSGPADTMAYLASGGIGVKTSENWRALASIDAVISSSSDDTKKGKYIEGSLGYAYRPAEGDRWNALFKYTFLYDHPGADQISVDGTRSGPLQRSHILSADVMYDINNYVTVGGKYAVRIGETKARDGSTGWMPSTAQLGILRMDLHVVHNWDALLEGRALYLTNNHTADLGLVAAIYRHLGDNLKLGVGYNFGAFSDDLRDQTLNDQGVFVNVIGEW